MSLPHACHRPYTQQSAESPRLLLRMHGAQFLIASCAHELLDFCVPDVRATLTIQTYCTRFIDNLTLNEWLDLSRMCAVVMDDVPSIRVYNCNATWPSL